MKTKIIVLLTTLALSATLFAVASAATGAYFSDSKAGAITGTIGSVKVATSGGTGADGLTFNWDKMLPGTVYTASATYQNIGDGNQDIWLVFPNKTALSAFNSKGRFAAVRVTSTDGYSFYSNNLNDHFNDQSDTLKGLPVKVRIAAGVVPSGSGTLTFSFQYAGKVSWTQPGGVFNLYPLAQAPDSVYSSAWPLDGCQAGYDQNFVDAKDGTGTGLPFKIIATQPNVDPDIAYSAAPYAGF